MYLAFLAFSSTQTDLGVQEPGKTVEWLPGGTHPDLTGTSPGYGGVGQGCPFTWAYQQVSEKH